MVIIYRKECVKIFTSFGIRTYFTYNKNKTNAKEIEKEKGAKGYKKVTLILNLIGKRDYLNLWLGV